MNLGTFSNLYKSCLTIVSCIILSGCALDFGGSGKSWDFKPGFEHLKIGPGKPGGFDKDGNYIPEIPEVVTTYSIPDISIGSIGTINGSNSKITPYTGVELFEFRIPYVRWFKTELVVGNQLTGFYLGKRWSSIFEITTGVFFGRDFDSDGWVWGIGADFIKF